MNYNLRPPAVLAQQRVRGATTPAAHRFHSVRFRSIALGMNIDSKSRPNMARHTALAGCAICGGALRQLAAFPRFPLTGLYSRSRARAQDPRFDLRLMHCARCAHAQLARSLDPRVLYGEQYGFRTSESATASAGARFFADYLAGITARRGLGRVLEFGCNDIYLMRMLERRADALLGVDPVLAGREAEFRTAKIRVLGKSIESVDVAAEMGGAPDLVICQHTLEHVLEPAAILRRLFELAARSTLFVFEVPCFDVLVGNLRFDQVFHQHVHYYSLESFRALVESCGGELVGHAFNHGYWGALLVAFRKARPGAARRPRPRRRPAGPTASAGAIQRRLDLFRGQMAAARALIREEPRERLYGYGAALMLPALGYHLQTDFGGFAAILDDDPAKDGLGYANLRVRIRRPQGLDLAQAAVVLTALDNRRPILRRLAELRPRRIINPLACM